MQQFIPFEDDWDMLESLRPDALIPYRVGFIDAVPAGGTDVARQATSSTPLLSLGSLSRREVSVDSAVK